jgi:cold shock CspA family protein
MPRGTIKRLVPDPGVGFITPNTGEPDRTFHHTVVGMHFDQLQEGQRVEYDVHLDLVDRQPVRALTVRPIRGRCMPARSAPSPSIRWLVVTALAIVTALMPGASRAAPAGCSVSGEAFGARSAGLGPVARVVLPPGGTNTVASVQGAAIMPGSCWPAWE